MIPTKLKLLIENQAGNTHRTEKQSVTEALKQLNIDTNSELAEFF